MVQPDSSLVYAVFGDNGFCEPSKVFVPVAVIPLPTVSAGLDQFICIGALSGATLNGAASNGNYVWLPSDYLSNTNTLNTISNPTQLGIYSYTLTVTEDHGCTAYDTVKVTVGNALTVNAGTDISLCSGTITALSPAATAAATLTWLPTTGISTNTITATATYSAPISATATAAYILTVSAPSCNDVSDTINITVWALPTLITSNNITICQGTSTDLSAMGAVQYTWSPSDGLTSTIGNQVTTTLFATTPYTVTGIDTNGCVQTNNVTVYINTPAQVIASDDIITNCGTTIISASGADNYLWTPTEGLSCSNCPNPTSNPQKTTLFTVTGTNTFGCFTQDSVKVTVFCLELFVPEAFSPNDDKDNDSLQLFIPKGEIKNMTFKVYDRWGNEVFKTNDINTTWDGKYQNQTLQDAVFVYFWDVTDVFDQNKVINGNISLIR